MAHVPVLLKEIISLLDLRPGETVIDGTVNRGGHSKEFCQAVGRGGTLLGIDQDKQALAGAEENLADCDAQLILKQGNFRNIDQVAKESGLTGADAILLDIGFSSDQIESSGRGFSFQKDEPLYMTFGDPEQAVTTAIDIVNDWSEESLVDIIKGFGQESFAKRIAQAIILARQNEMIQTTGQLVEIIRRAVPVWYTKKRVHFATKTFQAIRMAVNDELGSLKEGIINGFNILNPGGRLAVISFHSLEAKQAKDLFKNLVKSDLAEFVNKKAIKPSREEVLSNPRSRSAQLRIIKKK